MSESYMIYKYIKKIIADNTDIASCHFDDMDTKEENSCGVFISESQVHKDRRLGDGSYTKRIGHVLINYNCKKDKEGLLKGKDNLEKLRDIFETTHNKVIYFKDNEIANKEDYEVYLNIGQIDLLSGVVRLGKNEYEIPRLSIRLKLNYIKGGK